ncbi:MAG: cytochrome c [Proteobacteria bacterium]|nr:cytochrome c [Pseudomonadota bacterium]
MYRSKSNPLEAEGSSLEEGRDVFRNRCVACHGLEGRGDGSQIEYMDSLPTDLTAGFHLPVSRDAYLYWTLALGGARFNTQMPHFKNTKGMPILENP